MQQDAALCQDLRDLPTLRPWCRATPLDLLNRAVGCCKTCYSRWSTGNPLSVSTTNADIGIGTENPGRDENSLGDEIAGEGASSIQPRESVFTDSPNLPDNQLSAADRLLISYWLDLIALPNQCYDVPSGAIGQWFLFALADIFDGVVEMQWNAERFIVYTEVILQHQKGVKSYHNVRWRMKHRVDLWEKGDHKGLVEDTIKVNKCQQPTGQRNKLAEHICWVYTRMFLQGKLHQAVQWVTGRDKGGLFLPSDTDSNTGLT
eukprot:13504733-Ditylum_brightwellii.AAC.1